MEAGRVFGASPVVAGRPATAPPAPQPTAIAREDVALRLFYLLHSPPLSLASLVRAGLLGEEEDLHGHYTLVSTAPVASPVAASPPSVFSAESGTAASHNGNERTNTTPAVRSNQQTPASSQRTPLQMAPSLLPAQIDQICTDALRSPVAVSALALTSPTSASTAAFRSVPISADTVAHRLASLYAHHPPYALREWLHKEVTRLGCPNYQDPVSNDIVATAEALRQREALVALYIRLCEDHDPQAPASTSDGQRAKDPEMAAWGRGLHQLMGCHHVRERHCPHRALDGFRRNSTHAASTHGAEVGAQVQPTQLSSCATTESLPRPPLRPRTGKDASVALLFVRQMLRNTPASRPPESRRAQRDGTDAAPAAQAATGTTASSLASCAGTQEMGGSVYKSEADISPIAGGNITFIRHPDVARGVGNAETIAASQRTRDSARLAEQQSHNAEPLDEVEAKNLGRRDAPDITSLDCMIGVETSEAAQGSAGAADAASNAPSSSLFAIPMRRGPRIRLHPSALAVSTSSEHDAGSGTADVSANADRAPVLQHDARRRRRGRRVCDSRSGDANSSSSSSSSSSVSLPVAGEEGEDELSPSSVEESEDENDEEGEEGVSTESIVDDDRDVQGIAIERAIFTEGKHSDLVGRTGVDGGGGERGSRRVSMHGQPTAAAASTATTVDFLASHTGGLLNPPLTAAAVSKLRGDVAAQQPQQANHVAATDGTAASANLDEQAKSPTLHLGELPSHARPSNPLLAGYSLTQPFVLTELPPSEATAVLHLPFYAQAHELNRLAGLRRRTCYQDPYTNCLILTSWFLDGLPHCFGEYCKHCPHGEVCERRLLQPALQQQQQRRRGGHHTWRVVKPAQVKQELPEHAHLEKESSGSCIGSSSNSSSSSGGSSINDGDEDDPEALRFFAELDAADAAAATQTTKRAPTDSQLKSSLLAPKIVAGAAASRENGTSALRAFSSHSTPSSSSQASALSDGDEDEDEQHRHHLLRSAALYSYGDGVAGSTAGVVVQVNSMRDLLLWGTSGDVATMIHAPDPRGVSASGNNGAAAASNRKTARAHASIALLSASLERTVDRADAGLLVGDEAAAVVMDTMDVEELLRRHEASFEQYAYLDSSGL